jgi:DNA-binding MarR family transcriptional regulator
MQVDRKRSTSVELLAQAEPGTDEALARDLGLLMRYLLGQSNREIFAMFDELDISFTQTKIIMAFDGPDDSKSLKTIADEYGLTLPTASRAVDVLLERGIVSRTEDPDDRRVRRVALTEAGRDIAQRFVDLRVGGIYSFLDSLTPEQRAGLAEALAPIAAREDIAASMPSLRKEPSNA